MHNTPQFYGESTMMTTVNLNIPKKRLRYINTEIQRGRYRDLDDFVSKSLDTTFDSYDFNDMLERRVNEAIEKGEKLPFPVIKNDEDMEKYLDEVKGEPIEVKDIGAYIQKIYDDAIARGGRRKRETI